MINYLTYNFLVFLRFLVSSIPRKFTLFLGKLLGIFIYYIIPIRKKVAKINISIAFPELSDKEVNKIILKSYKHYGMLLFEFITQNNKNIYNNIDELDNKTKKCLTDDVGKILMTAHIGNWELMLPVISKLKKIIGVAREQKNKGANKFIIENRSFNNVELISNKGSTRKMAKALLKNKILLLVCDQNAKSKGNKLLFFNKESSFPKGPGYFHFLTNSELLYGFCILNKNYKYELKIRNLNIEKKIEQKDELVIQINRLYIKKLEEIIIKYPEQYFWFHKKWDKTIYDS
tara:strand:- start:481 stop:1347 length:867 start_codon:yes stop_codon:yes gene_type:complete